MKTCTFFGHRNCPESIKLLLAREIERLICEKDVTGFLVGDTGCFDHLVRDVLAFPKGSLIKRKTPVWAFRFERI